MLEGLLALFFAVVPARAQEDYPEPPAAVESGTPKAPPGSPEQTIPEAPPTGAPPPSEPGEAPDAPIPPPSPQTEQPAMEPAPQVPPAEPSMAPPPPEPAPVIIPPPPPPKEEAKVPPPPPEPPAEPISGMVLMPTAYRGTGRASHSDIGMSLDFNAAYYIGRVYGKNEYDWTLEKTNYIDRIGQWFLMVDGKMQVQSEGDWRPALSAGGLGMFAFRDAPQPTIGGTSGSSVKADVDKSDQFGAFYAVGSKRFWRKYVVTLGWMQGDIPKIFPLLTEFLSPAALAQSGQVGATATADSMLFGGLLWQPTRSVYGIEIMKPQNMALDPLLVNFNLGSLLKLNFQLSYLKFDGGWDLLGMIQFRYTQFPRR